MQNREAYDALMRHYPLTLDNLEGEEWRNVEGYEGLYQVSNFGRIKSFKRYSNGKILKPVLTSTGYLGGCLGRGKHFKIHRLVAEAFILNPQNKPHINHIDGHPLNNCTENLEWCTHAENMRHAVRIGLHSQGERNSLAKLTCEQVLYIRNNPDGLQGKTLAEMFGVGKATIHRVQTGKRYKTTGGVIRSSHKKEVK